MLSTALEISCLALRWTTVVALSCKRAGHQNIKANANWQSVTCSFKFQESRKSSASNTRILKQKFYLRAHSTCVPCGLFLARAQFSMARWQRQGQVEYYVLTCSGFSPVSKWMISKECLTMRQAISFLPLLRPFIIREQVRRSTMGHWALRKRLAA